MLQMLSVEADGHRAVLHEVRPGERGDETASSSTTATSVSVRGVSSVHDIGFGRRYSFYSANIACNDVEVRWAPCLGGVASVAAKEVRTRQQLQPFLDSSMRLSACTYG